MQIFDLNKIKVFPYEEREKNVFYSTREFKTRIIELSAGGKMPVCKMESYVIFQILKGTVFIYVNGQENRMESNQCLITEPAEISMESKTDGKILGIQVTKNREVNN